METRLHYEEKLITPEIAKKLLEEHGNQHNRKTTPGQVHRYAKAMKEGKWLLNGEAIFFDWNGTLLNGHNRMKAVIEAGVSVPFSIINNVDPDAFKTIDNGKSRSSADVFKMAHIDNYSNVASIVKKFDMLNRNLSVVNSDKSSDVHSNFKLSNEEALSIYELHPYDFQEFCCYSMNLRNHRNYYNISELGGIMAYLHFTLGYSKELIYRFFNCLFQYKTEEENILCKEVREVITKTALNGYKLSGVYKQAILATAWNCYATQNIKRKKLNVKLNTSPVQFK